MSHRRNREVSLLHLVTDSEKVDEFSASDGESAKQNVDEAERRRPASNGGLKTIAHAHYQISEMRKFGSLSAVTVQREFP